MLFRSQGTESTIDYTPSGHMYQVRINAKPEHFLEAQKPLSEQSETVRNALKKMMLGDPRKMTRDYTPEETVKLRELGVPGIRYRADARNDIGDAAYNYVLFDDKLVDITHKNGQPVERRLMDALTKGQQ